MATTAIFNGTVPESDSDSDVESASAADFLGTYQVFLNFRGPDTRYGFTDYLYHDLVGAGVHTFRDDNELREGEEIGPELFKAINDSKISIPIFSKYYAFSKWCLRELAQMVKCREDGRQMIYPIFYDVEPGEVKRYQDYKDGTFQEAFRKHEEDKELDRDTVQQWKEALKVVGKLKGPELKKVTNGHEGALVKIIVKKVLLKLKKNNMHLPKDLVGMQAHIEKLKELLNSDSNGLRIIGIRGMSGLGKTTIAKAIYNELNKFFESHCFLEDVRGKSQQEVDLINLQKHLLSKILKRKIPKIDDVDEGTKQIKGAIHGKKVFIVLDNVDDIVQIEKLAANHNNWDLYGAGSKIIITTTNKEVLLASKVISYYKPELMGDSDALKLFCKFAFERNSPLEGSLLSIEKDKGQWEATFEKLKAIPRKEVQERLRISYDALDDVQKQIYLDIACFFTGVDKMNPCYMWDDCKFHPREGIEALIRRSLITVREDNILRMHDQLRELGRQIVKQNLADPGERCRLWDHGEAFDTLKKHLVPSKSKCRTYIWPGDNPHEEHAWIIGSMASELKSLKDLCIEVKKKGIKSCTMLMLGSIIIFLGLVDINEVHF
ncbi:hypothetical protein LguiA_018702 [Lonicera macranthoides]